MGEGMADVIPLDNSWYWATAATAFAFALWLWSAYSALDRTSAGRREHVWVVVGWFIPFGNLFMPKVVLDEIVVAQERHSRGTAKGRFVRNWVTAWWACWIVLA